MNPVGPNVNNQLAKKQANDARLLATDTAKGQNLTANTLGRTVNQTTQDVKQTAVEVPKEKVTLSTEKAQPEAKEYGSVTQEEQVKSPQAKSTEETSQSPPSKSGQSLMAFTDTLFGLQEGNKKDLEDIITQSAMIDTSKLPAGESGREVALAATALRAAVAKLQAKMPGATKEQIREAAKTDPEVAKWASIADAAGVYLNDIKAESPQAASQAAVAADPNAVEAASGQPLGAPGKGQEMMQNPFKLNPEQQAQMFAENVKTMEAIRNIYQQMWAEISKARAQRHQLMMETANAINSMIMESHVNRMKSSENHRKSIMAVILEQGK
jgi:hypothetical protein